MIEPFVRVIGESLFTEEDTQQEYQVALLEGFSPADAERKALEARAAFRLG